MLAIIFYAIFSAIASAYVSTIHANATAAKFTVAPAMVVLPIGYKRAG
jgi:hypothetical protein